MYCVCTVCVLYVCTVYVLCVYCVCTVYVLCMYMLSILRVHNECCACCTCRTAEGDIGERISQIRSEITTLWFKVHDFCIDIVGY